MTSYDKYHKARTNLRAYGETRKRKVKARVVVDGVEVAQLDDSKDEEVERDRAVNVEEVGLGAANEGGSHPNPQ
ncbi:unnamed protein product [Linum trigynum]|uniref:Uncharacterized protein n=1 Tax=Linum trigynum TaxID=586398 RepID=A0AAV2E965_9ROSI